MKLSIGIVGLPNVGKSTLFKILTKQEITIANYPFATIDPNVGVVSVPDDRLSILTKISNSRRTLPAIVEFYDIAGLVKGANKGEGLGNQFLSHIRECAAIVQVLRCFGGEEIIHVEESTDPLRDFGIIKMELILKDLDTVEKRLKKAEVEARTGDKQAVYLLEVLKKLVTILQSGEYPPILLREELAIKELALLTLKPQIFLLNGKESDVNEELKKAIHDMKSEYIIADLNSVENIDGLIEKAYQVLGLISFFTTGEDETRAWTIKRGAKAPEAAGAIHTDFEKNFIRAEVVHYDKFLEAGGWNQSKQKGWLRVEGKEYTVLDGDVVVIRHGA